MSAWAIGPRAIAPACRTARLPAPALPLADAPEAQDQISTELRLDAVLRSLGTKVPGELCRYAKIIPLMCSRLGETRTAAPTEVDLEQELC